MKNTIYIFLFFIQLGFSQNSNRVYQSHSEKDGVLSVLTNDGKYLFQFYSEDIIEATFIPNSESEESKKKSHAVILNSIKNSSSIYLKEDDNSLNYSIKRSRKKCTEEKFCNYNISVKIQKKPFKVSYFYRNREVISEKRGYYKNSHQRMEIVKENIVADSTEKIEFNLKKNEILYGGGARALGMNRRGNRLPLFNRAHYGYETKSELMNYTMPIVLSSNKYLIHFDNTPIGYLDFDSKTDNTLTYETISGRKTYQVIVGDTWYDILDNYTDLTGKQPMLPRWALGNFASRFGYHSQKEVETTITKFKEEKIPVDAVILDLYWFGKDVKGTMGNLKFDKDSFPNPKQMIKNLQAQNVETILITEPFILSTSNRWTEAVRENILAKDSVGNPAKYDFYFGNTGIIDIYKNEGQKWFSNVYKDLAEYGVAGFWGDLGEPEVHPNWVKYTIGSAAEVHNIYGHDWAKLVYNTSLKVNPKKRPFVLMRAGYSGSQRFGMVPWSGDVNRTWSGLKSQPEIALQMGMQGLAYMHSDLGGFAGANLDDALYVRWLQYGVFQPIFRPHAQEEVPSEPVFRAEKPKQLAKKAIELRYKLLPYNYNLMYENNKSGKPLMRPLFFEEPDNNNLYNYSKTYLWGNDILVSPVLENSIKKQPVYFPKTASWFDFYTDKKIKGGQTQAIQIKENYIPTFIRAGAFIPLEKQNQQSTKDFRKRDLEIHYYHDITVLNSQRSIYDDKAYDNKYDYKDEYMFTHLTSKLKKENLNIYIESELGKASGFSSRVSSFVIHNSSKKPQYVKLDGKKIDFKYNKNRIFFTINYRHNEKKKKIKIKF